MLLIVITYLFSDLTTITVVWMLLTNTGCIITSTVLFLYLLHTTN